MCSGDVSLRLHARSVRPVRRCSIRFGEGREKTGFNRRFPPRGPRLRNVCTERGISFRISQFEYHSSSQRVDTPKQNASFVRRADARTRWSQPACTVLLHESSASTSSFRRTSGHGKHQRGFKMRECIGLCEQSGQLVGDGMCRVQRKTDNS
jgi:hypothetical protein